MVTHRPKGMMCYTCAKCSDDCSHIDFTLMVPIAKDKDGTIVVKCSYRIKGETK